MFNNLTDRLNSALKSIKGQGRLTEDNLQSAIKDIRHALIEADVALLVINKFIDAIKEKSLGEKVALELNPGQAFVKIIQQELIAILGSKSIELNLKTQPPAVIMLAGLQGSGKTTTAAKLANFLQSNKKKVMLTSTDVYRPAAIEQLCVLGQQLDIPVYVNSDTNDPITLAKEALASAKSAVTDILIVDTAGRMHIDSEMMLEIKKLHKILSPIETMFVVDSMTGVDAANTAKTFGENLDLTGIVLTKTDGDSRGGAALSTSMVSGKPIKFIGTGEKIKDFEKFHPDRMANRILGMGDVISLIESAEESADQTKAKKLTKKLSKGKAFDFNDLKEQLQQMNQMGGLEQIMKKMPGTNQMKGMDLNKQSKELSKSMAIISSMTKKEKKFPKLLNGSRKKRIAKGSGTEVSDINRLIKQLLNMQKMMKKFTKFGNMQSMMQKFKGGFPPSV